MNLTQENLKPLVAGKTLDMTYSVKWSQTNITFARRFDVYLDYPFFEHQVTQLTSCLFVNHFISHIMSSKFQATVDYIFKY